MERRAFVVVSGFLLLGMLTMGSHLSQAHHWEQGGSGSTSDVPWATGPNNATKLVVGPGGRVHWVAQVHFDPPVEATVYSTWDGCTGWTGHDMWFPCVDFTEHWWGHPWVSTISIDDPMHYMDKWWCDLLDYPPTQWRMFAIFAWGHPQCWGFFWHPAITVDENGDVNMAVELSDWAHPVPFCQLLYSHSDLLSPYVIKERDQPYTLRYPSIAVDAGYEYPNDPYVLWLLWEEDAQIHGAWQGGGGPEDWTHYGRISEQEECHHPAIRSSTDPLYRVDVVWEARNAPDPHWQVFYAMPWLGTWLAQYRVTNTSGESVDPVPVSVWWSDYPYIVWSDNCEAGGPYRDYELYYTYSTTDRGPGIFPVSPEWVDPVRITTTDTDSRYPQVDYRPAPFPIVGGYLELMWTEGNGAPYGVYHAPIFISPWHAPITKYSVNLGQADASPYTVYRDGYIEYGPEDHESVDYAADTTLIYRFPGMDPAKRYGIKVCFYHEGGNVRRQRLDLEGTDHVDVGVVPEAPEWIGRRILPACLEDSQLTVNIECLSGDTAVLAYVAVFDLDGVDGLGGGPQEASEIEMPGTFNLGQNRPNPFRSHTEIYYSLDKPSHAVVRIYDASGKLVRTLVDDVQKPGFYSTTWNGRDYAGRQVASGLYFYRLSAGGFATTKKMVVLK